MASTRWNITPDEHAFIEKHQAHITRAKLTEMLNDEFDQNLSVEQAATARHANLFISNAYADN